MKLYIVTGLMIPLLLNKIDSTEYKHRYGLYLMILIILTSILFIVDEVMI